MNTKLPLVLLVALAILPAGQAAACMNDFPTQERVEFVLECARDAQEKVASPTAGSEEYIYKCSCVIDQLAQKLTYDQYVEQSTAAKSFTIGGERGEVVRGYGKGKEQARHYRNVVADARKACFIH